MSDNNWKTPATVIGILTVLVAIVGLYLKFKDLEETVRKNDEEQIVNRRHQEDTDSQRIRHIQALAEFDAQIQGFQSKIDTCDDEIQNAQLGISIYGPKVNKMILTEEERADARNNFAIAKDNYEMYKSALVKFKEEKKEKEKEKSDFISKFP